MGGVLFSDPKQPTKVGQIEFDVLISQETTLASEVTENPVEDGFPVHDHVVCQPIKLSMVVAVSPLPVTWYSKFGVNAGRLDDAAAKLEEIYKERKPVTVVTKSKTYEDMVMTDCKISRTKEDGFILKIPLEFTQIRKVETKSTEIPAEYADALAKGKAGATAQDAGAADTQNIGSGGSGSGSGNNSQGESSGKRSSMIKGVMGGVFGK